MLAAPYDKYAGGMAYAATYPSDAAGFAGFSEGLLFLAPAPIAIVRMYIVNRTSSDVLFTLAINDTGLPSGNSFQRRMPQEPLKPRQWWTSAEGNIYWPMNTGQAFIAFHNWPAGPTDPVGIVVSVIDR